MSSFLYHVSLLQFLIWFSVLQCKSQTTQTGNKIGILVQPELQQDIRNTVQQSIEEYNQQHAGDNFKVVEYSNNLVQSTIHLSMDGVDVLIGPYTAASAESILPIASEFSVPLVSPLLASRLDSSLIGLMPSASAEVDAILSLCNEFGWRSIAVLTSSASTLIEMANILESKSTSRNIQVKIQMVFEGTPNGSRFTSISNSSDPARLQAPLKLIKESGTRIILFIGHPSDVPDLLSSAKSLDMLGSPWTYLGTSHWITDNELAEHQIYGKQLKGAIGVSPLRTAESWKNLLYDSVTLAARALTDVNYHQQHCFSLSPVFPCSSFLTSAGRSSVLSILVLNQTFVGRSGEISFNSTTGRSAQNFSILNFQGQSVETIGFVDGKIVTLERKVIWPQIPAGYRATVIEFMSNKQDETIPLAERQVVLSLHVINRAVLWSILCLVGFGLILCFALQAFNVLYRTHPYVRISSPAMNCLTILGCQMALIYVILDGVDSEMTGVEYSSLCMSRAVMLGAGYMLSFGAMFVKTWRILVIFGVIRKNMKVVKLTDLKLLYGVAGFLTVVLIYFTIWFSADPMTREIRLLEQYHHPVDINIIVQEFSEHCTSHHQQIWLGVIYAYLALWLIVGTSLSYSVRTVKVSGANEARLIMSCVYQVGLISSIIIPAAHVMENDLTAAFVLVGAGICFMVACILFSLFSPKIRRVFMSTEEDSDQTAEKDTTEKGSTGGSTISDQMKRASIKARPSARASYIHNPSVSATSKHIRSASSNPRPTSPISNRGSIILSPSQQVQDQMNRRRSQSLQIDTAKSVELTAAAAAAAAPSPSVYDSPRSASPSPSISREYSSVIISFNEPQTPVSPSAVFHFPPTSPAVVRPIVLRASPVATARRTRRRRSVSLGRVPVYAVPDFLAPARNSPSNSYNNSPGSHTPSQRSRIESIDNLAFTVDGPDSLYSPNPRMTQEPIRLHMSPITP